MGLKNETFRRKYILFGTLLGAIPMAILGASTADPDAFIFGYTAAGGAAGGELLEGITGAAIGGINILVKDSKTSIIKGNTDLWQSLKESIIKYLRNGTFSYNRYFFCRFRNLFIKSWSLLVCRCL